MTLNDMNNRLKHYSLNFECLEDDGGFLDALIYFNNINILFDINNRSVKVNKTAYDFSRKLFYHMKGIV